MSNGLEAKSSPNSTTRFTPAFSGTWILVQNLLRLSLVFVVTLALARYLQPVVFGQYQVVLSLLLLAGSLASLGLQAVLVDRFLQAGEEPRVLGTALAMRLVGGLVVWVLVAVWAWMHISTWNAAMGLLWASPLLLWQASDVFEFLCQSRLRGDVVAKVRSFALLVSMATVIFGMQHGFGLTWFLAAAGLEYFVAAIIFVLWNQRQGIAANHWRWDRGFAFELFVQSWPVLLSSLSLYAWMRMDIVMVEYFCSSREVGVFAAAARLAQMSYFLPFVLINAVFPLLFTLRKQNNPAYAPQLENTFVLLGLLAWIITIPMVLLAHWFVPLLLGESYAESAGLLVLQGWTALFYFVRVGLDRHLVGERKTKYSLLHHGANAIANFILNLWLIPLYGTWGAALASLVSLSVFGVLSAIIPRGTRGHGRLTMCALLAPWYLMRRGIKPLRQLLTSPS